MPADEHSLSAIRYFPNSSIHLITRTARAGHHSENCPKIICRQLRSFIVSFLAEVAATALSKATGITEPMRLLASGSSGYYSRDRENAALSREHSLLQSACLLGTSALTSSPPVNRFRLHCSLQRIYSVIFRSQDFPVFTLAAPLSE